MSLLNKTLARKYKNINSYSSPAIMSVILLISMLIIFSIDVLGLSNREKNVELRITSIDHMTLITNIEKPKLEELASQIVKFDVTEWKNSLKEEQLKNIQKILLHGIQNQLDYLQEYYHHDEDSLVIFDI